jgi:hypothetical protein
MILFHLIQFTPAPSGIKGITDNCHYGAALFALFAGEIDREGSNLIYQRRAFVKKPSTPPCVWTEHDAPVPTDRELQHSPVRVDRATHHKNFVRHYKHIARHPNSLKLAWLFS